MNNKLKSICKEKYGAYQYEDKIKNIEDYIKYLKESKNKNTVDSTNIWKINNSPYFDIDNEYKEKNHLFYSNLCTYLEIQEKEKKWSDNKWLYKFDLYKGISINNGEILLRSDSLGFSAPHIRNKEEVAWDSRYPYSHYLKFYGDEKDIATIVFNTRSLGGSLLWPVVKQEKQSRSIYNVKKGVSDYIDDRADITLYEIKQFYLCLKKYNDSIDQFKDIKEEMNKKYILLRNADSFKIYEWLKHFKTFNGYIEFFSFQDFVDTEKGYDDAENGYLIYNLTSDPSNKTILTNPHMEKRVYKMDKIELENMLININNQVVSRTIRMVDDVINGKANKK